ncbi:MAG: hypothetical protein HKP12_12395 [Gammaproteobacteria bacterium]|nr:hypothetical protein [Gammaproteobacteria bacterium]NNJ97945.1 hypothetical protein [Gammaproteobacteria bacterium]
MNKIAYFTVSVAVLFLTNYSVAMAAASAVTINYGKVTSVQTVEKEASHAGGALAGGLLAAGLAGPRHRGLKIAGSAAAGAAIQGAATSGSTTQITVKLVEGGQVNITTEQQDFREGDCVMVEQGEHANIRRASSYHCEQGEKTKKSEPTVQHKANADYCQKAKSQLAKAETDEAIENAVKKVRVLCED